MGIIRIGAIPSRFPKILMITGTIILFPLLYILMSHSSIDGNKKHRNHKHFSNYINHPKMILLTDTTKYGSGGIIEDVTSVDEQMFKVLHEEKAINSIKQHEEISKISKNIINFPEKRDWGKVHPMQNIPDNFILDMVANDNPNMPIKFWKEIENIRHEMFLSNSSCAPYPDLFKIRTHNKYWQTVDMTESTTIQLYSAYYDKREITHGKDVRILSMVNRIKMNFPGNRTLYCQLWFKDEIEPVIAPMNKVDYIWIDYWNSHEEGSFAPYLLGCSIPESHQDKIPQVVSFVENPCDKAMNMLRVVYEQPAKKKEFAVCVKGLDFLQNDLSIRLVEWIEVIQLMGVDKIFFYQLEVHPNIEKVLNYYSKLGIVDVRPITLSGNNVNIPLLQHEFLTNNNLQQCFDELIPYNDCFYRNLYSYQYIALLDIDEIIFPLKDKNWHDLIKRAKSYENVDEKVNGYTARHILFMDSMQKEEPYQDIPPYMHMMQHVFRSQNYTEPGEYVKTIFNTNYTISCFNHWPLSWADGSVQVEFELDDARMQHYRNSCPWDGDCKPYTDDPVKDTALWSYKDIVIPKVVQALSNIGLIEI